MSKMSKKVTENRVNEVNAVPANGHANYMGGISYTLNPLETLKMISAYSAKTCGIKNCNVIGKSGVKEVFCNIGRFSEGYGRILFQNFQVFFKKMYGKLHHFLRK